MLEREEGKVAGDSHAIRRLQRLAGAEIHYTPIRRNGVITLLFPARYM